MQDPSLSVCLEQSQVEFHIFFVYFVLFFRDNSFVFPKWNLLFAALRELFKTKEERTMDISVPESEEEIKTEIVDCKMIENEADESTPLTGLNDAADEFFDVPEPSDDEEGWPSDTSPDSRYVVFSVLEFELYLLSKTAFNIL